MHDQMGVHNGGSLGDGARAHQTILRGAFVFYRAFERALKSGRPMERNLENNRDVHYLAMMMT